jgi:hypothetical protein
LGNPERESTIKVEMAFYLILVDFEMIVGKLPELISNDCGSGDRKLDLTTRNGYIRVALDSFARHSDSQGYVLFTFCAFLEMSWIGEGGDKREWR